MGVYCIPYNAHSSTPIFYSESVADPDPYVFGDLVDPDPLVRGTDPDPSIIKQK
jgi:hypothetical protein